MLSSANAVAGRASSAAAIARLAGAYTGRNKAVGWADLVWTVATAGPADTLDGIGIEEQTEIALRVIDKNLKELGSNK